MEETETTDALNTACSLVNHFAVDEDINIEIQHSRRKVVPSWFWERFEDEENFSRKLNQLLQAVNPYFWKEIPSFPTLLPWCPHRHVPPSRAGCWNSVLLTYSRERSSQGSRREAQERLRCREELALHSLCFSSRCLR